MDIRDRILELMKAKGPVIPSNIAKEINSNILMSSALLSELSSKGKVKISSLKVGGTPLYYLPGQEPSLQNFSNNPHEKERKAFDLLKEKKILRDNNLEPVVRVALREIKDFAVPLHVTHNNGTEIFWKWYLLGKDETESLAKELLLGKESKKEEPKKEIIEKDVSKELKREEIKKEIKREETRKEPRKAEEVKKEAKQEKSVFFDEIRSYFSKNKISIKNTEIIRKNAEISFIVEVPSSVGNLRYYCVAKSKKRISDGDLSSAYIQAQSKKLPVLFLTKGELTKNAKEILEKEFKGMSINKL